MNKRKVRVLLRNFVIELIVYGILVTAYSIIVLRLLGEPLSRFFDSNLTVYAFISLGLIVAQGVVLDLVTSFLLDRLRLGRPE